MNEFPISAEQLYELTKPEQRVFPLMWEEEQFINNKDISNKSKKYSLPFWPKNLFEKISKILHESNNSGKHLSFIFQINLDGTTYSNLPTKGLIQFYAINEDYRIVDNNEKEKLSFEKIMGENNTGIYHLIYISEEYLNEEPVQADTILSLLDSYDDQEPAHTIHVQQRAFELPLMHNSMFHALRKMGYETQSIKESFQQYINRTDVSKLNEDLNLLFANTPDLFPHILKSLYHPLLKNTFGNKIGGFPLYVNEDNREKDVTFFDFLLFQIDTTENNSNSKRYIMGINTNKEEIKAWSKAPTLNMKESISTMLHKQLA